ncbi:MAG: hypothetical protein GKC10_08495, partial [Methanosarcinales archaeon]|nr:hypothetical protein [Methanosarcinales archaeon]
EGAAEDVKEEAEGAAEEAKEKAQPGFEAIFAITGLLSVSYFLLKRE